jgi:predicted transcriptional regulator
LPRLLDEGEDVSEELARKSGAVLNSKAKTRIVMSLAGGPKRFSQLLEHLNATHGNLHYHLISLKSEGIVNSAESNYKLTPTGETIARLVGELWASGKTKQKPRHE